jgi:hypothetical protein
MGTDGDACHRLSIALSDFSPCLPGLALNLLSISIVDHLGLAG